MTISSFKEPFSRLMSLGELLFSEKVFSLNAIKPEPLDGL